MFGIPFEVTEWNGVAAEEHKGGTGLAVSRTKSFGDIRVRMVEYSPGYSADHWCAKGHILLCLDGELRTELEDGTVVTLFAGMSYQVGDGTCRHRSSTPVGAKLFIID